MNQPHRILLCDDHDLVRQSVKGILKRQADLQVVGEAPAVRPGIMPR